MGGSGSTRWRLHNKKTTVEDCRKLTIFAFKPYLHLGVNGSIRWSRGVQETGSISYRVVGNESPEKIRLLYTTTDRYTGEKMDYDYFIQLQTTPLPWGGVRYWFTCPLVINNNPCQRRVGVLYIPPGGKYFGCWHCYDLTYQSSQEKGYYDGLYKMLAASMYETHPGITSKDVEYLLSKKKGKAPVGFYQRMMGSYPYEYIPVDPHAGYLTAAELCEQAGLSQDDLSRLETVRLLLPDTKYGRYRPKLAGWARKLNYLLESGWEIEEIKRWAKGRWKASNPRKWPPDCELWKEAIND